jgi:hypothetical protein
MIILRATNDDGFKVDLDVLESNAPIKLDISAIENTQIGQSFGISSQTFSLPGSATNNAFFGNLFDLGATPAVALENSIACQVLTDGAEVFTGKLYITDIVTDQKGYTTYQVNVVNETVDFKFQLTDTLLNELDWSEYSHSYTYANISSSWQEKLFSGSIIYPHVNYGQPEGDATISEYGFNGSRTFDNVTFPLRVDQFKPAIKVKDVVDKIFEATDYEYTSEFISSSYFDSLYTLTTPFDGLGVLNANSATGSVWAYRTSTQSFNALTSTKVNYNAEVFDNFSRFNLTTDRYTAYASGLYNFALGFRFSISNYDVDNRGRFFIRLAKNGTSLGPSRVYPDAPQSGILYVPFPNISLVNTDFLEVFIEFQTDDGSEVVFLTGGQDNTYFKVEGPRSFGGGQVDIGLQFPNELKAIDFLQGIIEKFNLVVEPVPNTRNVLRIEPYNDWVLAGKTVDWTDKVDRSSRFKIVHPITQQPKFIFFKDEDDEAIHNRYTQVNFGDTFGSYTYSNDSDLCLGERRIGKVFAATPVKGIPNGDSMIIPHLCRTDSEVNASRPFKFKPRLLHKNGVKAVPSTAAGSSGSLNTFGTYFFQDETFVIHRESVYYSMTTFDNIPTSFATGSDLHFGNLNWYQYFQYTGINGRVVNDAFQVYWANYINSLYDIDARKLTCNIFLRPNEIQDIALNDKIFIDGHYYRINKISGANITYDDTVEVEFIKELNREIPYPRRRTVIGTVAQDIVVREVQENGKVVYEDFDGGQTVEDYGRIKQAAFKDHYTVFEIAGSSGSVSWTTPAPVILSETKAVYGSNNVDVTSNAMFVAGGNNTVANQTSNGFIVGNNNEIKAGTLNATITGVDNTIEVLQNNVSILGAVGAALSGSNNNSMIIGGTGSIQVNNDWGIQINGYSDALRDSDNTTAINSHQNEVIINGSGHTVIGLNREGAGLNLLSTRNNSNFLGDTYIGGGVLRDSFTINVGDGTNYFLTGSNYGTGKHESLYLLNWNGLSPGTASIHLPSATNNDYKGVEYTFKANETFDSTTYLQLVPFDPAQTLDGQTTLALSAQFDVVTIFNTGSKWFTLSGGVGTGGGGGAASTGSYLAAYNSSSITPSANVSASVPLPSVEFNNGIAITSGSRITFDNEGVYDIQFSAQAVKSTGTDVTVLVWIKKNGVDVEWTNTENVLAGNANDEVVFAWNWYVEAVPGDYYEIAYVADTSTLTWQAKTGVTGPDIPSWIVTVGSIGGGSGTVIPTLQQVTAAGNDTSILVELNGGAHISSSFSSSVDAYINNIRVGRGPDNNPTNIVVGVNNMLSASVNPDPNEGNIIIGTNAAKKLGGGYQNVIIGLDAFSEGSSTDLAYATALGAYAFKSASYTLNHYGIGLGAFAGTYTTDDRRFIVNAHDRGSADGDITGSLLYGLLDATPISQGLRVNASTVNLPYISQSLYGHILTYKSSSEDKGFEKGRVAFTPIGRIGFPYTGSAVISGSLNLIGNLSLSGSANISQSLSVETLQVRGIVTGSLSVSGSVNVSGSLRGNYVYLPSAVTHSINTNLGNFFEIDLNNLGSTHLQLTNVEIGQTINILVNTDVTSTGSMTFSNNIKQPTGSIYVPTQAANSIDALSIVTGYSGSTPVGFLVNVKNFL